MTKHPTGNGKAVIITIGIGAALLALGGCSGGVKNACLKFNEEMRANLNANPIELVEKVDSTNKRLADAVGITFYGGRDRTPERAQSNMIGMVEAGKKCMKEGVPLGG
jgi:hypothetical protein